MISLGIVRKHVQLRDAILYDASIFNTFDKLVAAHVRQAALSGASDNDDNNSGSARQWEHVYVHIGDAARAARAQQLSGGHVQVALCAALLKYTLNAHATGGRANTGDSTAVRVAALWRLVERYRLHDTLWRLLASLFPTSGEAGVNDVAGRIAEILGPAAEGQVLALATYACTALLKRAEWDAFVGHVSNSGGGGGGGGGAISLDSVEPSVWQLQTMLFGVVPMLATADSSRLLAWFCARIALLPDGAPTYFDVERMRSACGELHLDAVSQARFDSEYAHTLFDSEAMKLEFGRQSHQGASGGGGGRGMAANKHSPEHWIVRTSLVRVSASTDGVDEWIDGCSRVFSTQSMNLQTTRLLSVVLRSVRECCVDSDTRTRLIRMLRASVKRPTVSVQTVHAVIELLSSLDAAANRMLVLELSELVLVHYGWLPSRHQQTVRDSCARDAWRPFVTTDVDAGVDGAAAGVDWLLQRLAARTGTPHLRPFGNTGAYAFDTLAGTSDMQRQLTSCLNTITLERTRDTAVLEALAALALVFPVTLYLRLLDMCVSVSGFHRIFSAVLVKVPPATLPCGTATADAGAASAAPIGIACVLFAHVALTSAALHKGTLKARNFIAAYRAFLAVQCSRTLFRSVVHDTLLALARHTLDADGASLLRAVAVAGGAGGAVALRTVCSASSAALSVVGTLATLIVETVAWLRLYACMFARAGGEVASSVERMGDIDALFELALQCVCVLRLACQFRAGSSSAEAPLLALLGCFAADEEEAVATRDGARQQAAFVLLLGRVCTRLATSAAVVRSWPRLCVPLLRMRSATSSMYAADTMALMSPTVVAPKPASASASAWLDTAVCHLLAGATCADAAFHCGTALAQHCRRLARRDGERSSVVQLTLAMCSVATSLAATEIDRVVWSVLAAALIELPRYSESCEATICTLILPHTDDGDVQELQEHEQGYGVGGRVLATVAFLVSLVDAMTSLRDEDLTSLMLAAMGAASDNSGASTLYVRDVRARTTRKLLQCALGGVPPCSADGIGTLRLRVGVATLVAHLFETLWLLPSPLPHDDGADTEEVANLQLCEVLLVQMLSFSSDTATAARAHADAADAAATAAAADAVEDLALAPADSAAMAGLVPMARYVASVFARAAEHDGALRAVRPHVVRSLVEKWQTVAATGVRFQVW